MLDRYKLPENISDEHTRTHTNKQTNNNTWYIENNYKFGSVRRDIA